MCLRSLFVVAATLLGGVPAAAQPKALFYMNENAASVQSFRAHKDKIEILVPTWYSLNAAGLVAGGPNPDIVREAKAAHISVVPIIAMFDKDAAHKLFGDPKAQAEMNAALVRECKSNGYDGIQFDLENISWTDRDGLSAMIANSAAILHRAGLQVQIATVPNAPGHPGNSEYARWMFEDWRGVYDLKALAASVDLLCLMTYDQHTRWTTPGPVAGWEWTTQNLQYALQFVPRNKLSLGIALYGYHWYSGNPGLGKPEQKPNITADYISGPNAMFLRDTYHGHPQWDAQDHTAFFWFYRDQEREWIFYTDRQTFADRYELAQQNELQGFCSWVLGEEDPDIWNVLHSHTQP